MAKAPHREITGFCCPTLGLEGGFILGGQRFNRFNVHFKNQDGNITTKRYLLIMETAGFQLGTSAKLSFIFFLNTDHNFFNKEGTIAIGKGISSTIDLSLGFSYSMATLVGLPGAVLIFSLDVGLMLGISLVTGGILIPWI